MNLAIALNRPTQLKTEPAQSPISAYEYVTLLHRGTCRFENGDEFRLLQRAPEAQWSARRLEKDRLSANFQGDPLWPQKVLERYENLRQWFGLSANHDETHALLPQTATINRRLEAITGRTSGFRDLRDYKREPDGHLRDHEYVDAFIDEGVLPMGEIDDRDSIHDWSYHFVTFLMPDYLDQVRANLAYIRARLQQLTGQTSYAWNYYGHTLDGEGRMRGTPVRETLSHADAVYRQMAIALDVATAKPVQLLALERAGRIQNCRGEEKALAVFLGGVSQAALDQILWMEPQSPFVAARTEIPAEVMGYLHAQLQRAEVCAQKRVQHETAPEEEFSRSQILAFLADEKRKAFLSPS